MRSITIRELVNEHGLSLFAVRHYERKGLVSPSRGSRNRRLYSPADVQRLKTTTELAAMGVPLAEIRELLDDDETIPPDRIEAMIQRFVRRRDELSSRILKLRAYQDR